MASRSVTKGSTVCRRSGSPCEGGTLEGTAELLRERDPESIRRSVAPPGGATEAGLEALEAGGFEAAIAAAVAASLERFR